MRLPGELTQAIEREIAGVEARALARAAAELSLRFRGSGRQYGGEPPQPGGALSQAQRLAYLAVRMPATFAAAGAALRAAKAQLPRITVRSLLDLGAGPGTAAWAALEVFPELERIELIERDARMIELGKRLAANSTHQALRQAEWLHADLCKLGTAELSGAYDLVIAGYALGEQPVATWASVVIPAWKRAHKLVAVVEPGTPRGYETVLRARDLLLDLGGRMVAPCPHHRDCPMRAIPGEWCHFAQRLERTSLHRRLKAAALGYEDEKFSYVVAAKARVAPAAARIVRHPQSAPGKITLKLCGQSGLKEKIVRRSQREEFRAARQAKWGDAWPPVSAPDQR